MVHVIRPGLVHAAQLMHCPQKQKDKGSDDSDETPSFRGAGLFLDLSSETQCWGICHACARWICIFLIFLKENIIPIYMLIFYLLCLPKCLNQDVHMESYGIVDPEFKEDDLRRDHSAKNVGVNPNSG